MNGREVGSPGITEILRSVGGVVERASRRPTFGRDCRDLSRAARREAHRHNPCYSESMPIGLEEEPDSIFRIEMRGMLRKADLDRCQARLALK